MANSTREYGLRESREMEADIEAAITEFVARQRPTIKDIRFTQLFTEVVRPNQEIRAHLRYTIVDSTASGEEVEQAFHGTLTLVKSKEDQTWKNSSIDIVSPLVEFIEGAQISARADGQEDGPDDGPKDGPGKQIPAATPTPAPQNPTPAPPQPAGNPGQ